MPQYTYSAINERSRTIRGTMVAENEIDLEARLREVGLDLVNCKQAAKRSGGKTKIKLKDMILLCLQLEQLCRSGVPVHEAIGDVRDSTESIKLRDIMTDVLERVKTGTTLSEALAIYPRVFDEIFV